MASEQRLLRILTVTPPRKLGAPSLIEQGIMPIGNGGGIAAGDLTPEQIDRLQRALYTKPVTPEPYNRIPRRDEASVLRGRLLSMGRRDGQTSMIMAGRYLAEHGDDARRELRKAWATLPAGMYQPIDALLDRAGVPARAPEQMEVGS